MKTRSLLALIYLFASVTGAAPPPELTLLLTQYEKVLAERVSAPHDAAIKDLNAKFITALGNAGAQAKGAGDLPAVLAITADQKLLGAGESLPEDDDTTPEALKKLRTIYREQLQRLAQQKMANVSAVQGPYTARLKELEATLTKADRVDEAKEVMAYRTGLVADVPASGVASATAPPAAMPRPEPAAKMPKVRGDDRKAAEWVLSIGGTVKVGAADIKSVEALPRGQFVVTSVILPTPMPDTPDAAFDQLAGLTDLKVFQTSGGGNQTDAAFRFLSSCPQLIRVDVQNWVNLEGAWLQYLASSQNLEALWVTSSAKSDLSGLAQLPGGKLEWLQLRGTGINADTVKAIGRFKQLSLLSLRETKIGDESLPVLASLPHLEALNVMQTEITNKGLLSLAKLSVKSLGFGSRLSDLPAEIATVAAAFPKLEALELPPGTFAATDLAMLGAAWPKIKMLSISSTTDVQADAFAGLPKIWPQMEELVLSKTNITDTHMADIAKLKKLALLRIATCNQLTPACLSVLQKMGGLKNLGIKPGQFPEAGLQAFKKQRPDVTLQTW